MPGMLRTALVAATVLLPSACEKTPDPDRRITGGGVVAEGWSLRLDHPDASRQDVRFVRGDGGGFDASNGPNAIFWRPDRTVDGVYTLRASVTHLNNHGHHHGAGVIFGGRDLDGAGQRYTYFLVHGGGKYLIKTRDGEETAAVAGYAAHDAIRRADDVGVSTNELEVRVDERETAFLVNGVEVHRAATQAIHTDGHYGFRMVHNLDLRFGEITVSRPARDG